jgi:hypothetical protein
MCYLRMYTTAVGFIRSQPSEHRDIFVYITCVIGKTVIRNKSQNYYFVYLTVRILEDNTYLTCDGKFQRSSRMGKRHFQNTL